MNWTVGLAVAALTFVCFRMRRGRNRLAEVATTGMLRSPLFLARTAFQVILLCLIFGPAYLPRHSHVAVAAYLCVLALDLLALLLVHRALKWRYPI